MVTNFSNVFTFYSYVKLFLRFSGFSFIMLSDYFIKNFLNAIGVIIVVTMLITIIET